MHQSQVCRLLTITCIKFPFLLALVLAVLALLLALTLAVLALRLPQGSPILDLGGRG